MGFLGYDHAGDAASFESSKDALHHLPDFWKMEALKNVGDSLRDGGTLRLRDFVFSFEPEESLDAIEPWIATQTENTSSSAEAVHVHFREKFSTYGFLLEARLERGGFEVLDATYDGDFYAMYTCRWNPLPGASGQECPLARTRLGRTTPSRDTTEA